MFTWGSFWQEIAKLIPPLFWLFCGLILGFLLGKLPERRKWKLYLAAYNNRLSQDKVEKLEKQKSKLQGDLDGLKEAHMAQQVLLRAAREQVRQANDVLARA